MVNWGCEERGYSVSLMYKPLVFIEVIVSDETEWKDPIVAEVQTVRDRLAKRFNYDIAAIFGHLRAREAEYAAQGFRFVDLPIKRVNIETND